MARRQAFHLCTAAIAVDIRQYQAMGVSHLVVDIVQSSQNLDEILRKMEAFATLVWPLV